MNELIVHDESGLRTVTFNRPQAKNALTRAMRVELCELLDAADRDVSVKVLILTGTDPAFSAGVDFKDMDPAFDPRDRRFTVNPGRALRAMRTPVICAVNGPCISGGLEIASAARSLWPPTEPSSLTRTHGSMSYPRGSHRPSPACRRHSKSSRDVVDWR